MKRIKYYYFITVRLVYSFGLCVIAGIIFYFSITEGINLEYISTLILIGVMLVCGQLIFQYIVTSIVRIIVLEEKVILIDLRQKQREFSKQEILPAVKKTNGYEIRTKSGKKFHTYAGAGKVFVVINNIEYEGIRSTDFM